MRKHYINPQTITQLMSSANRICVGSIHGNADLEFGGGSDGSNENEKPF